MRDLRAFSQCSDSEAPAGELVLSASESHHLVAVNRAREGDVVVVSNGVGCEWECELIEASKSAARLRIISRIKEISIPCKITLGQALPKGGVMDDIVRKATEIGAAEIIPLASERSQVHLDLARQEKKREKWSVAALEAAKQCGTPWVPKVSAIMKVDDLIREARHFDLKLIASLYKGAESLRDTLDAYSAERKTDFPGKVLWMIGPEGDFSPEEMRLAIAHGFKPISLGPLVLRCDTAATYALSILSHEINSRLV